MKSVLKISNLYVAVDQKSIITDLNLEVAPGSIHVIMGANGSGKSTLAHALMGHPSYTITRGTITLSDIDITAVSVDKRAHAGLFLSFQHPYEIPGVTVYNFIKEAHYARFKQTITPKAFQDLLYQTMNLLEIDLAFAHRALNYGFSGGEKKKLELLQLLILNPQVATLDEIDSGLDVDAIKMVAYGLHKARELNADLAFIIITHYPRLLSYINPDFVHVLRDGLIVKTGGLEIASLIEQRGYDAIGA
jgi:Fe-S cluster assembly ATP-binding protein